MTNGTLETKEDSQGGTLYTVKPNEGIRVRPVGYWKTEAEAIASYINAGGLYETPVPEG